MPRVPQVDLPSVGLQAGMQPQFQAPQVTPMRDFTGQQIEQVGQGMAQLGAGALRLEDRINDSKASEADAELAEFQLAAWNDYKGNLGKNAIDNKKKYLEDMDKKRQEIASRLDNGFQQDAFARSANYRTLQFRENVERHFEDQSKAYFIGTREARIKANSSLYGESQDDVLFQTILADVDFIADELQYEPQDPRRAQMKLQAQDNAHTEALGRMVSGPNKNLALANEYFKKHSGAMSPGLRATFGEKLYEFSTDADAQTITQQLQQLGPPGTHISMVDDMWDMGLFGDNIQLRDKVVARLNQSAENQRAEKQRSELDLTNRYERLFDQARASGQSPQDVYSNNPQLLLELEATGLKAQAEEYFAVGSMRATPTGEVLMRAVTQDPSVLRGKPLTEVYQYGRKFMTPRQLAEVEALWVTQNAGLPGSGIPAAGKRVTAAEEILSNKNWLQFTLREHAGIDMNKPYDKLTDDEKGRIELLQFRFDNSAPPALRDGSSPTWKKDVKEWLGTFGKRTLVFDGEERAAFELAPSAVAGSEFRYRQGDQTITRPMSEFAQGSTGHTKAIRVAQAAYNALSEDEKRSQRGMQLREAAEGRDDYLAIETYMATLFEQGKRDAMDMQIFQAEAAQADALLDTRLFPTSNQLQSLIPSLIGQQGQIDADPWAITESLYEAGYFDLTPQDWAASKTRQSALKRISDAIAQHNAAVRSTEDQPGRYAYSQYAIPSKSAPTAKSVEVVRERVKRSQDQRTLDAKLSAYITTVPISIAKEALAQPGNLAKLEEAFLASDPNVVAITLKYPTSPGRDYNNGFSFPSVEPYRDPNLRTASSGFNLVTKEPYFDIMRRALQARVDAHERTITENIRKQTESWKSQATSRAVEAIRKTSLLTTQQPK